MVIPLSDKVIKEFSPAPFWFWNDDLSQKEIKRQLDDFKAHGVYGVVIHPRIGLPKTIKFMSPLWLDFVEQAVVHAKKKGMFVYLYDEGMYPSGSAQGEVVRRNPQFAARSLRRDWGNKTKGPTLEPGETLVHSVTQKDGRELFLIDAPSHGTIRGLHFDEEDGCRNAPKATDLLNPEAVKSFIDIVHEGYRKRLHRYFGSVIKGIFTDEPSLLGRCHRLDVFPWTTGLEKTLETHLGKNVKSRLPELWDNPSTFKRAFHQAVGKVFDTTYYEPISRWCTNNNIALIGHPEKSDDMGRLRFFQIPCQDVITDYIVPYHHNALRSQHATMAKCSASAALHEGRFRNGNECLGNTGHDLTYDHMLWITNWLMARGVNLIIPHAFYYSIRGKRINERPPDVGPNSTWWNRYRPFASYVSRVCHLLALSKPMSKVAVLGNGDFLPFESASLLQENQIDFQYVDLESIDPKHISKGNLTHGTHRYSCVVLEKSVRCSTSDKNVLAALKKQGLLLSFNLKSVKSFVAAVRKLTGIHSIIEKAEPHLRALPLLYQNKPLVLLCNEGGSPLNLRLKFEFKGPYELYDPWKNRSAGCPETTTLPPMGMVFVSAQRK